MGLEREREGGRSSGWRDRATSYYTQVKYTASLICV